MTGQKIKRLTPTINKFIPNPGSILPIDSLCDFEQSVSMGVLFGRWKPLGPWPLHSTPANLRPGAFGVYMIDRQMAGFGFSDGDQIRSITSFGIGQPIVPADRCTIFSILHQLDVSNAFFGVFKDAYNSYYSQPRYYYIPTPSTDEQITMLAMVCKTPSLIETAFNWYLNKLGYGKTEE